MPVFSRLGYAFLALFTIFTLACQKEESFDPALADMSQLKTPAPAGWVELTPETNHHFDFKIGTKNAILGCFLQTNHGVTTKTSRVKIGYTCFASFECLADLKNVRLLIDGRQFGLPAESFANNDNAAVFESADAPVISSGQSVRSCIQADLASGLGPEGELHLWGSEDITFIDSAGFPALPDTKNFPLKISSISIQAGHLTATPSPDSPHGTTQPGSGKLLLVFDIGSWGEASKITNITIGVKLLNGLKPNDITNLELKDEAGGSIGSIFQNLEGKWSLLLFKDLAHIVLEDNQRSVAVYADIKDGAHGRIQTSVFGMVGLGLASHQRFGPAYQTIESKLTVQ